MRDLLKALRRLKVETGSLACLGCGHEHNCATKGCAIIRAAIAEIEAAPAVDAVEVRHGEWKFDGDDWFCNKCNRNALCDKDTGNQVLSVVCPACGARMDGRREEEHNAAN